MRVISFSTTCYSAADIFILLSHFEAAKIEMRSIKIGCEIQSGRKAPSQFIRTSFTLDSS